VGRLRHPARRGLLLTAYVAYRVGGVLMLSLVVQPRWRQRLQLVTTKDQVTAMSTSHDGKLLAVARLDGTIRIHSTAGGWDLAATLRVEHPSRALAWSASNRYLLAGTAAVPYWDHHTGTSEQTTQPHDGAIRAITAARQAPLFAVGTDDGTVRIGMTDRWTSPPGQQQHGDAVQALAITADGRWLASTGRDGQLKVWDTTTTEVVTVMRTEQPIIACYWRADELTLRCGGPGGLYSFDLHTTSDPVPFENPSRLLGLIGTP
jgi:WD40 repeat protein